jgi:hypothetical protein
VHVNQQCRVATAPQVEVTDPLLSSTAAAGRS